VIRALTGLALIGAVAVLAAGCGGGGGGTTAAQPAFDGAVLQDQSQAAPDFTLDDQDGRPVSVAAQRGHWLVVTFLYTHCPDVCPLIAANLNGALVSPTGKQAGLRVIAVSVDPKRDTPAAVRRYVAEHRLAPTFHYVIGTRAQLRPVWRAYNVATRPGPSGTVAHSSFELLVDPQGKLRLVYDANVKTAQVVHDLKLLTR
jgi:protein SCO1/2